METTEQAQPGTIEAALDSILQPEEPEVIEEEVQEEPETEVVDESEDEDIDEVEEVTAEDDDTEDEYEDTEEVEDSAPELYTVKVDGKEEQVSLEDLKRGYSGQKYVQKGMQEAAELRKQMEARNADLLNQQQILNQTIQMLQTEGLPQAPVMPSSEMAENDPLGYIAAQAAYTEQKAEYDQKINQLTQVYQQQQQLSQQEQAAYLQREMETLKQVIPEFADPEKATSVRDRLVNKGNEIYGYTAEEIGSVMDHRAIRVLNDAIKYQELQSGKQKAVQEAKPKNRRVVKAGAKKVSSNANAERQARSKLKRSGSIDDALSLILNS